MFLWGVQQCLLTDHFHSDKEMDGGHHKMAAGVEEQALHECDVVDIPL